MIIFPFHKSITLLLFLIIFLWTPVSFSQTSHFLTLADIHFDPFVNCRHQDKHACELIDLLEQTPEKKWQAVLVNSHQSLFSLGKDTNFTLLKIILNHAKKIAINNQIKFVLVLGDVLAHEYKRSYYRYAKHPNELKYRLFVNKTLGFLSFMLKDSFPNVNIYFVVGNNDSYGGDYVTVSRGDFFKNTALIWGNLSIPSQFQEAGYYALTLPNDKNIRLIVLNTVLFSNKAKGKNTDIAAKKELKWLNQELIAAGLKQQKVFLAMHIPPSMDINLSDRIHLFTLLKLWRPIYKMQFQQILQDSSAVVAMFAGHLHLDGLTHLKTGVGQKRVLILQTTSISPIYGNAPGFKLYGYQADTDSIKLIDYSAYFLNKSGKLYEQHGALPLL